MLDDRSDFTSSVAMRQLRRDLCSVSLSRKSEVNKIKRKYKDGEISKDELDDELKELKVKPSPAAFSIPQVGHKHIPLFSNRTSVVELDYDRIVYDTYDYLDKVVSLSLADPISAALDIYYNKFNDDRSIVLKNYVKYGTNDDVEILLIRYGFDPEDFVWLIEHIDEIDETAIVFKESVLNEPFERLMIIDRYL